MTNELFNENTEHVFSQRIMNKSIVWERRFVSCNDEMMTMMIILANTDAITNCDSQCDIVFESNNFSQLRYEISSRKVFFESFPCINFWNGIQQLALVFYCQQFYPRYLPETICNATQHIWGSTTMAILPKFGPILETEELNASVQNWKYPHTRDRITVMYSMTHDTYDPYRMHYSISSPIRYGLWFIQIICTASIYRTKDFEVQYYDTQFWPSHFCIDMIE